MGMFPYICQLLVCWGTHQGSAETHQGAQKRGDVLVLSEQPPFVACMAEVLRKRELRTCQIQLGGRRDALKVADNTDSRVSLFNL